MSWFDRNKHLYPANWKQIATAVKDAAGWCCEACGAPHGPSPRVLTVHHIDHEPANISLLNLSALCQRCHLKCQSLKPRPSTKEEAIERLQPWIALRDAQMPLMEVEVSA